MNKFISSVVVLIICHMIILTDTDNYFGHLSPRVDVKRKIKNTLRVVNIIHRI